MYHIPNQNERQVLYSNNSKKISKYNSKWFVRYQYNVQKQLKYNTYYNQIPIAVYDLDSCKLLRIKDKCYTQRVIKNTFSTTLKSTACQKVLPKGTVKTSSAIKPSNRMVAWKVLGLGLIPEWLGIKVLSLNIRTNLSDREVISGISRLNSPPLVWSRSHLIMNVFLDLLQKFVFGLVISQNAIQPKHIIC